MSPSFMTGPPWRGSILESGGRLLAGATPPGIIAPTDARDHLGRGDGAVTARTARIACLVALAALAVGVYARNLDDYFLGDDFDLIQSFYGEPPSYFLKLLW